MKSKYCYLAETYYHLLITLIKVIKSNAKTDLILPSSALIDNRELLNKIYNTKLFNEILFIDYKKMNNRYLNLIRLFFYINSILDKNKYEEIYVFHDKPSIFFLILNIKKIPYNILEDGVNFFKEYNKPLALRKGKNSIKNIIFKLLKMPKPFESKYIKSIEVNDKEDIWVKNKNIIEVPRVKLFESLTTTEKETITNIFLNDNIKINNNSVLILTQPLSEDSLCSSEEEKIKIYSNILKEYCADEKDVVLKVHPRDKTNYEKYFNNITILSNKFPMEILTFSPDLKFKKILTVSSSAIETIKNCDEKIVLGMDYINKVTGEKNDSTE